MKLTYEEYKARLEAEYFIVREGRTVHRRDTGEQLRKSHFLQRTAPIRYGYWAGTNYAYSTAARWLKDADAVGYDTLQEADAALFGQQAAGSPIGLGVQGAILDEAERLFVGRNYRPFNPDRFRRSGEIPATAAPILITDDTLDCAPGICMICGAVNRLALSEDAQFTHAHKCQLNSRRDQKGVRKFVLRMFLEEVGASAAERSAAAAKYHAVRAWHARRS